MVKSLVNFCSTCMNTFVKLYYTLSDKQEVETMTNWVKYYFIRSGFRTEDTPVFIYLVHQLRSKNTYC